MISTHVPEADPVENSEIFESIINDKNKQYGPLRGSMPSPGYDKASLDTNDGHLAPMGVTVVVTTTAELSPHRPSKYRRSASSGIRRQRWILAIVLVLIGVQYTPLVGWNWSITIATSAEWEAFSMDYHKRFGRSPPHDLQQWLAYAKYHQCETSEYYDDINQRLDAFRKDPNRNIHSSLDQLLDEAITHSKGYVLFDLNHNKLMIEKMKDNDSVPNYGGRPWWLAKAERYYKEWALRWLLQPLVRHQPPISTKFLWNLMDEPVDHPKLPIFSACSVVGDMDDDQKVDTHNSSPLPKEGQRVTKKSQPRDIPIPYHFSIGTIGTRGASGNMLLSLAYRMRFSRMQWRDRDDVITWRGSTTGAWDTGPRFRLVNTDVEGMNHPHVWDQFNSSHVKADFAFVSRRSLEPQGKELNPKYRVAERISFKDMQKYKYVLDVDGNSFSERFPKLLTSGTLVFKSTMYDEWFSERVKPWVHYVPVKYDLSDLHAHIAWADANPNLAEEMVLNARRVVEQHLRPQDQRCYVYRLLLEYQTILRN